MAPTASRMQTSAKKAGRGGSYSWGDAASLVDLELCGVTACPQVWVASTMPPQEKFIKLPALQAFDTLISDVNHFPQLGATQPPVLKRRSDAPAVKLLARRPAPPAEAPPPAPLRLACESVGVDDMLSLLIDWAAPGTKTQRGAAFQQLFLSHQSPSSSHKDMDSVAMLIDWSVEETKGQRTEAFGQGNASELGIQHSKVVAIGVSLEEVNADPLTMMIDWSAAGLKSQRAAAYQQATAEDEQTLTGKPSKHSITSAPNASADGCTTDEPIDAESDSGANLLVEIQDDCISAGAETTATEPALLDVSKAVGQAADDKHDELHVADGSPPLSAQSQNEVITEQASHEDSDWAFVDEAHDKTPHEDDVAFTVVPVMHVRENQVGFSAQRSRNTFAKMPRRATNGKENAAPIIDWAADGSSAFQQAARKLSSNPAHLGPHQVQQPRSQTPHRALKAQTKADHAFGKIPNKAPAVRPRRERSRSLVTQKRGR